VPTDRSMLQLALPASQTGALAGQTCTRPVIGVVAAPPTGLTPTVQVIASPASALSAGDDAKVIAVLRAITLSVSLSLLGTSSESPA